MTIIEAAVKVLQDYSSGLSSKEIFEQIVSNDYYTFGAQDPEGVLTIELKRHCEGAKISQQSGDKCLVCEKQGNTVIYKLRFVKGQKMDENKKLKYICTEINGIKIYTFIMTVKDLANISYVAVRGKDDEEGAVQRVLNRQRIASIKNYVLNDNMFVNTFVLNWTNVDSLPSITDEYI